MNLPEQSHQKPQHYKIHKGVSFRTLSDTFQSSFKGFFDVSLVFEIHLVNMQKNKQNFSSKYLCRHAVEVVQ